MNLNKESCTKRTTPIEDNDSSPEDESYTPPVVKKSKKREQCYDLCDPDDVVNTVFDPEQHKFVRRSPRTKKGTELFVKSEFFYGNKVLKSNPTSEARAAATNQRKIPKKRSNARQDGTASKTNATKKICIKREFTEGDIVSVDGRYLGIPYLEHITNPPTFYGTVESLVKYDWEDVQHIGDDQSLVHIVLSGNCQWEDKEEYNSNRFTIYDEYLTLEVPSPINPKYQPHHDLKDCVKWFVKKPCSWEVQPMEGCDECGSPWCEYEQKQDEIERVLNDVAKMSNTTNKRRRCNAYRQIYFLTKEGGDSRIRLGFCIENAVRAAFPDEEYVGFVGKKVAPKPKK